MGTPFRASSRLISDRLDGGARTAVEAIRRSFGDRDSVTAAWADILASRWGELLLDEGRMVPRAAILLRNAVERWGAPSVIVCDRWRSGDLTDALADAGLRCRVLHRGLGFRDGEADIGLAMTAPPGREDSRVPCAC